MNHQEFQKLVEFLGEMPEALQYLTKDLSSEELKKKPSEKEFSVLEHVWHLSDIESEGYSVRIEKLLTEDQPVLRDIDGGKLALERGYNNLNLAAGLEAFTHARRGNIRRIKALSLEQLDRRGIFEHAGPVTLERVILMMREHDEAHRRELNDMAYLFDIS
jgi:hypothetical protein